MVSVVPIVPDRGVQGFWPSAIFRIVAALNLHTHLIEGRKCSLRPRVALVRHEATLEQSIAVYEGANHGFNLS